MATITENIFTALKKMFSNDVIIRRVGKKELKTVDINNSQTLGNLATNYLTNKYSNLYSSSNVTSYGFNPGVSNLSMRLNLFRDYEFMEQDPIISSALDLYSEESTLKNEFGEIMTISSTNKEIQDILHNLFYDVLNIEFNLQLWVRNLVKYGDWFMKLDIAEKLGIVNIIPVSAYSVVRIEGDFKNPNVVRFKVEGSLDLDGEYNNYEFAHFRLLNDSNFIPYGKSMIESARRIWKQLTLMEDAMLIHRIMRAPQKRVFKIDVGNIHPNDIDGYMNKIMNQIKKVPYIDKNTGDYNLKYNMQNIVEDFYLPIRNGDSGTSIETLDGLEYQAIDDIEYLRNKLMAALRIPKAFLGYEEGLNSKATLASEDVRFARTIEKIQKIIIHELTKIATVHLYVQGYDDDELLNFDLKLTSPSTVYEQEKIELWKAKVDLATTIKDQKYLSSDWIYENIYQMNDTERSIQRNNIISDIKREFRHQQILDGGNDPVVTDQVVSDDGTVSGFNNRDKIYYEPKNSSSKESTESDNAVGRPEKTNSTYSTDKHDLGRDPIGKKDIKNTLKIDKNFKQSSGLNKEYKNGLKKYRSNTKQHIINEKHNKNKKIQKNLSDIINNDD